jgi:four helix bundle protein
MLNAQWATPNDKPQAVAALLLNMRNIIAPPSGKPYDIHERLLDFAGALVRTAQFLHDSGPIGRALSYQLLSAGTSAGANAAEGDGATSHNDFVAKMRIALREAKEARFRLLVCRRTGLLDSEYDPLIDESDQLVRILGKSSTTRSAGAPLRPHYIVRVRHCALGIEH